MTDRIAPPTAADRIRLEEIRADVNVIASALTYEARDAIQGIVKFLLRQYDAAQSRIAELEAELDAAKATAEDEEASSLESADLIVRWRQQIASLTTELVAAREQIRDLQYAVDGALGYLLPQCKMEDGVRVVDGAPPRRAPTINHAPVAQRIERRSPEPKGDAALGQDFERLPVGDALRLYWLRRLPEGERRILEAVIGYYPDAATKAEIDEATGYKRSSRDTYIHRLRQRALVVTGHDGVRAADMLFGDGDG